MSFTNKLKEKQKYAHRLNLIDDKFSKKEIRKKILGNIDKTANYINVKNLEILKIPKLPYFKKRKKNLKHNYKKLVNNRVLSLEFKNDEEKQKLINEINRSFNELKLQDKERKKYLDLYGNIKEQNKINQYIIYHIMKDKKEKEKEELKENAENNDNNEKEIEKFKVINKSKSEVDIIVSVKRRKDYEKKSCIKRIF